MNLDLILSGFRDKFMCVLKYISNNWAIITFSIPYYNYYYYPNKY